MTLGLAQQLFCQRLEKAPPVGPWPLLASLRDLQTIEAPDYALTETFLENASEAHAAFFLYLTAAVRQGHLCVKHAHDTLTPALEDLWPALTHAEPLKALIVSGWDLPLPEIVREDSRAYFKRYWDDETLFLKAIPLVRRAPVEIPVDMNHLEARLTALKCEEKLLPEQAAAIRHAAEYPLTILTGGPGTGKTYTAGWLIRLLWESLPQNMQKTWQIALVAPTGKAAANLQIGLQRAIQEIPGFPEIKVQTLHKLLTIRPNVLRKEVLPLGFDFILVDESSMIDVSIMAQLFASIVPGTRLVLLGDHFQLPPVDAGSLFGDLVRLLPQQTIALQRCMRAELQGIITLSKILNDGDATGLDALLDHPADGVEFHELPEKMTLQALKKLVDSILPKFAMDTSTFTDEELLKHFQFRILTPFRRGPYGVDALNRHIHSLLSKACHAAPIMITKGDAQLGLNNGDSGVLLHDEEGKPTTAIFEGKSLPALFLPAFEYAYCLSVHKSQGSEFNHILLLLPDGSECFGRESLYTAATRARQKVEIWGHRATLVSTLKKKNQRQSGVLARGELL